MLPTEAPPTSTFHLQLAVCGTRPDLERLPVTPCIHPAFYPGKVNLTQSSVLSTPDALLTPFGGGESSYPKTLVFPYVPWGGKIVIGDWLRSSFINLHRS